VGTYQGGSLQVISHYSRKVISVDIDPEVASRLRPRFPGVDFRTGNSSTLLATLVAELNGAGRQPDFVLIDADHSTEAVRRDIHAILGLKVTKPMVVLMHDSYNPDCRAGILSADWQGCPQVAAVEVDLVQGIFHAKAHDTAVAGSMWGGFACALLGPESRTQPLVINQGHQSLFDAIYPRSSHRPRSRFLRWWR
jgi:hypothetical protein